MLLTISTTHTPATDLGYLLYKHPDKVQSFAFSRGTAHVFYPLATPEKCTAAMLLEVDPIGLIRKDNPNHSESFSLRNYVNDRPYVASSFMSVALTKVFASAMAGICREMQELADTAIPLEVTIDVLPSRGGLPVLEKLFLPLGYEMQATQYPLDEKFTDWGNSPYFSINLRHTIKLSELLTHLYVLIPVLDNEKHYYIGGHEMEKLLEKGKGWLEKHPEKELITKRYLKYIGSLSRTALTQLIEADTLTDESVEGENEAERIAEQDKVKVRLHDVRLETVFERLKESGAHSVLDLGCGEGKLLRMLIKERQFEKICGMDISSRALDIAKERIYYDNMSERQKGRISLIHGSLTYADKRLENFDAAVLVEVIEHLNMSRLRSLEHTVFKTARPGTVIVTTPNAEYNVTYQMEEGKLRHSDHRFEWTREEFGAWAARLASEVNYTVKIEPLGPVNEELGAPSQMAIFTCIGQ